MEASATAQAEAAMAGAGGDAVPFSLELSDDQRDLRDI